MSAQTQTRMKTSSLSVVVVVVLTIAALIFGWLVKTSTENRSRLYEKDGVSAQIPEGWLVKDGIADLKFTATNMLAPDMRYTVRLMEAGGLSLADVARLNSNQAVLAQTAFRVLDEMEVQRSGRAGTAYKVTTASVNAENPGLPQVVQGLDYYFDVDGRVLIVSFRSAADEFIARLAQFERFLDSIQVSSGGQP